MSAFTFPILGNGFAPGYPTVPSGYGGTGGGYVYFGPQLDGSGSGPMTTIGGTSPTAPRSSSSDTGWWSGFDMASLMNDAVSMGKSLLAWDVMKAQVDKGQSPSVGSPGLTGLVQGVSGSSSMFVWIGIAIVLLLLLRK
jgi:hypothetical protein